MEYIYNYSYVATDCKFASYIYIYQTSI